MDLLEPVLREDIQKVTRAHTLSLSFLFFTVSPSFMRAPIILQIWDLVRKPEAHKNTPLSEFFNVSR